ncbi:hypothetical protein [uncultured Parabacteroides sp.]|uniref:hypothetical protein n=1 Tax=uncultured Parabacteroides sp. TaxID=512312 RepID=UPI0026DBD0B9|nr:hypothetical protein [uncultured Parabacteroides sp.]
MKVVINGKEYTIVYSFRMYYVYESITGEMFTGATLLSMTVLFYSALLANNEEFPLTLEQFIDALDEDDSLLGNFKMFLTNEIEKRSLKKKEMANP